MRQPEQLHIDGVVPISRDPVGSGRGSKGFTLEMTLSIFTLPLSHEQASLETVDGKGWSLTITIQAGFPVPDGFHITTEAYRQFITVDGFRPLILAELKNVDTALPAPPEAVSAAINRPFAQAAIPENHAAEISAIYKALLEAVKKCRASLWTARAIAYRIKNNFNQNCVAIAVVMQEMVNANAAGILFTANPHQMVEQRCSTVPRSSKQQGCLTHIFNPSLGACLYQGMEPILQEVLSMASP